jgi:hypothetical protein
MAEENRARFKNDSRNVPVPRSASGPIAEPTVMGVRTVHDPNCVTGREMGPGILGAPLNPDPHRHGRHSNNLSVKPGEKPGSHYADENRRRIYGRDVKYR